MVSFVCDTCQETIKKPKLDQHAQRCRAAQFSCIDCSTTFNGTEYRSHTNCISEAEKYQKSLYKNPKAKQNNKGADKKQHKDTKQDATPSTVADAPAAATVIASVSAKNIAKPVTTDPIVAQIKKSEKPVDVAGEPATTTADAVVADTNDGESTSPSKKSKKRNRKAKSVATTDASAVTATVTESNAAVEQPSAKKLKKDQDADVSTAVDVGTTVVNDAMDVDVVPVDVSSDKKADKKQAADAKKAEKKQAADAKKAEKKEAAESKKAEKKESTETKEDEKEEAAEPKTADDNAKPALTKSQKKNLKKKEKAAKAITTTDKETKDVADENKSENKPATQNTATKTKANVPIPVAIPDNSIVQAITTIIKETPELSINGLKARIIKKITTDSDMKPAHVHKYIGTRVDQLVKIAFEDDVMRVVV